MNTLEWLNYILNELINGMPMAAFVQNNIQMIQSEALRILSNKDAETPYDIDVIDRIVKICNIIYNNTDSDTPLEDGVYDLLMVRYKKLKPMDYTIGGIPLNIALEVAKNGTNLPEPMIIWDSPDMIEGLFYDNLRTEPPVDRRLHERQFKCSPSTEGPSNKIIPHNYPKLVGTLDKCKFTISKEAVDAGCYDDPDVTIFERDFLGKHLRQGLFRSMDEITLILELKYDGMSVEADVTNTILAARSRGDTNLNLAEDLTHILRGFDFPYAKEIDDKPFGMKFECIITKHNLEKLGKLKNKAYKNSRNGVVGLMKSNDAAMYRDLITLVPLETSLDIDPVTEIEFMNKYYHNGTLLKYAVVTGTYDQVLFQVYKFVKEAERIRPNMPFMYDGVVVHYADPHIRQILGRVNSVNQYSIAIKFNAMTKTAKFLGYDFTVGQNGVITPMIMHTPIEFIGTIHTKSSGHSYARFHELGLAYGDIIEVQYRNDVMCYVTGRVSDDYARVNMDGTVNRPCEFITHCPSCGNPISIYDTGKTAICMNINCPSRLVGRVVNMLKKLSIKGFAEAAVTKLQLRGFSDLMSLINDEDRVYKALGKANGTKLLIALMRFANTHIDDYRVVGAIGFENVASESWKKVLKNISINDIINLERNVLYGKICAIKGLSDTVATTITNEREFYKDDLVVIMSMPFILRSFGATKRTVRYTGCRPTKALLDELYRLGLDANPNASVTKKTDFLLVPEVGFNSTKISKIGPQCKIVDIEEFERNLGHYLAL